VGTLGGGCPLLSASSLRHTPGIIALVALAREQGLDTVYVPAIDAREQLQQRRVERRTLDARRRALLRQVAEKAVERERILTLYRRNAIGITETECQLAAIELEATGLDDLLTALDAEPAIAVVSEAQLLAAESLLAQLQAELQAIEETDDWNRKRQIAELLVEGISVHTVDGTPRRKNADITLRYALGRQSTVVSSSLRTRYIHSTCMSTSPRSSPSTGSPWPRPATRTQCRCPRAARSRFARGSSTSRAGPSTISTS
jgi:hypothetical protein